MQNALARTVTRTTKHSRITPALKLLHWFKIEHRIQFKIVSIIHNLLHKSQPSYLRKAYLYQTYWQIPIIRSPLSLSSVTHIQAQILLSLIPKRCSVSLELSSHQSQVFSQQTPTPPSPTPLSFNTLSFTQSVPLSPQNTPILSFIPPP